MPEVYRRPQSQGLMISTTLPQTPDHTQECVLFHLIWIVSHEEVWLRGTQCILLHPEKPWVSKCRKTMHR